MMVSLTNHFFSKVIIPFSIQEMFRNSSRENTFSSAENGIAWK